MAELKSLSHTHVAIVDYMLANPQIALGDVAKHFGYTQPWLSQIIHSDAFQNMLKEKEGHVFHHTVLPIREKMTQVAHMALDKTLHLLPQETEVRTASEIAGDMLDRLGYGSKPVGPGGVQVNIQQNNMVVPNTNAAEIAAAREMLAAAKKSALGVQVDGVSIPLALPRTSASEVVEAVLDSRDAAAAGSDDQAESGYPVREEGAREAV